MEVKSGMEQKAPKTRRVWATVTRGGFANGQSWKLAVGASQDIPAAEADNWRQHESDLIVDLKNQLRLHLTAGESKPKLIDRVVQIIMK